MRKSILLGTRGSRLAMVQAEEVKKLLQERFPELHVHIKVIKTEGDQNPDASLSSFGGRGAFVQSIEKALLKKEIDIAVHSLKDLPSNLPKGLILGASPVREDPSDAIITRDGSKLKSLPEGSVIGTGSDRRIVQLRKIRPDLKFKNIRGNIETRLKKLNKENYDAVVIASAALKRLNMLQFVSEYMDPKNFIPAPCQGAIGIECRASDGETIKMLEKIDNPEIRICIDAERNFISTLGVGCHAPVGALARTDNAGIIFQAFVSIDKGVILEKTIKTSKDNLSKAVSDLAIKFRAEINKKSAKME